VSVRKLLKPGLRYSPLLQGNLEVEKAHSPIRELQHLFANCETKKEGFLAPRTFKVLGD
jgi:hypothetical protein